MEYTVQKLASLAGVSVRTLHYYDEIGLLKPSHIRDNGYRVYSEKEIMKLQQILFFRELEFSLEQIIEIVSNPRFNQQAALVEQKKMFELKKKRIDDLIQTVDKTLESLKGGGTMTNTKIFGSLSDKQLEEYKEEAKKRWGNTDAYKQSIERTKKWTASDYERIQKEGEDLTKALVAARSKGIRSMEVQKLIDKHYQYIGQFYDLSLEMYKNLGQMYVDDPRFTATYDAFGTGMAIFMRDAMAQYVKEHSK